MANIQAFRGIRYDLGHVGSLANVIAPPYDVIDREMQDDLYKKHPANVVRLILNRDEPGDEQDARYARAAKFLNSWKKQGVLFEEADPAIYVYHQTFTFAGQTYTRRGFMARCKLEKFGEGNIFPHEETHSAAKADRLKLFSACEHNLSQIFGIYPDETNDAQEKLETAIAGTAPLEVTDHLGVVHHLWTVTDTKVLSEVTSCLGPKPVFIADGHHRYETACNYRDEKLATESISDEHPANYVLMMFISMNDPGMVVLPTHRLFRGIRPTSLTALESQLSSCFETERVGSGVEFANELWQEIEIENKQSTLGLYSAVDNGWLRIRINETGQSRLSEIASSQSSQWCGLGVSILHQLVVGELLGYSDLPTPKYVHDIPEVVEGIHQGDTAGRDATGQAGSNEPFQLAALVMPASVNDVRAISLQGERMPAKSTYFYPKLLSGLVLNPLS